MTGVGTLAKTGSDQYCDSVLTPQLLPATRAFLNLSNFMTCDHFHIILEVKHG